jgi:hypothetical protein
VTKSRKNKLRRRTARRARRIPRAAIFTGEIGHSTGILFYEGWEAIEWTFRGARGITRPESVWRRRAAFGGRKGRVARAAVAQFERDMAEEAAYQESGLL